MDLGHCIVQLQIEGTRPQRRFLEISYAY